MWGPNDSDKLPNPGPEVRQVFAKASPFEPVKSAAFQKHLTSNVFACYFNTFSCPLTREKALGWLLGTSIKLVTLFLVSSHLSTQGLSFWDLTISSFSPIPYSLSCLPVQRLSQRTNEMLSQGNTHAHWWPVYYTQMQEQFVCPLTDQRMNRPQCQSSRLLFTHKKPQNTNTFCKFSLLPNHNAK